MTMPKKKRGFRSIVVNEQVFNWTVYEYLDIRSGIFQETKLHVELEWIDSRLPFEGRSYLDNLIVTPKLISESIQFALKMGWNPNIKTDAVFSIRYKHDSFSL